MQILKTYQEYIIKLFLKYLIIVSSVFATLIFILNVLEEIKFFNEINFSIYYSFLFTLLNLPSVLFEIFPFIMLITTQMFFMHLFNNDEMTIFKNHGVKNTNVIIIISLLTFVFGIFLIFGFHSFSSNLKHNYLSFKNKFTDDNKYLAVINENGLWLKDEIDNTTSIINAERVEKNILKNISISQMNENFNLEKTIIAEEADINSKQWDIRNVKIFQSNGKKIKLDIMVFNSNFDLEKINNLFSNLTSLNIFQLKSHYDDYKSFGYSTLDVESYINKLFAVPFYLVIMILIGSILMLNTKYNKSKIFNIIVGILISVMIYYIDYFFNLLGTNERIPITLSVWFPIFILLMFSTIGLIRINEK